MAGFDRDEAVWYYRLGDKALGPVAWTEIERLVEDALDAKQLQVARDPLVPWRTVAEVRAEYDLPDPAAEAEAAEVGDAEAQGAPKPLAPTHGLGAWLKQAWKIIIADYTRYFHAGLLLVALSVVTLMICFPALHGGLYAMALKRFRGEEVEARDTLLGFQHFKSLFGLYLLIFLLGLPFGVVAMLGAELLTVAVPEDAPQVIVAGLTWLSWVAVCLCMSLPGAAGFFAVPLIMDRGMTAMEAFGASWRVTRRAYFSYLGMTIVLSILSGAGLLLCWIGVTVTLALLPVAQVCAYEHYFKTR